MSRNNSLMSDYRQITVSLYFVSEEIKIVY